MPENLKHLLWYKQEQICHSRWLTTANNQWLLAIAVVWCEQSWCKGNSKFFRLISHIVSVYSPSFLVIHLNPKECEGPSSDIVATRFLAWYEVIDPRLYEVVSRYFIQHALSWLSPHNVALSLYSENPPFTKEALTSLFSLPEEVSVENLLLTITRGTVSKHFFTVDSKSALCVLLGSTEFWNCIDNHNRCKEREIGKLKDLLNRKKCQDLGSQGQQTDLRLYLYLCNSCSWMLSWWKVGSKYGMPHIKTMFV